MVGLSMGGGPRNAEKKGGDPDDFPGSGGRSEIESVGSYSGFNQRSWMNAFVKE